MSTTEHKHEHHIASAFQLWLIGGALIVLTILTVVVSSIPIQAPLDVISALASSTSEDTGDTDDSPYIAELLNGVESHKLLNIRDALVAVTPLPPKLCVIRTIVAAVEQLRQACKANNLISEMQRFVLEDSADPTSQLLHLQQFLQSTSSERGALVVYGSRLSVQRTRVIPLPPLLLVQHGNGSSQVQSQLPRLVQRRGKQSRPKIQRSQSSLHALHTASRRH